MKTKIGILYGLSHYSWFQYKKMGRTRQTIQKRISNMKTSLLGDIDIIYTTNELIDCYFYEYLMKLVLKNYRIKPNKEMFDICEDEIKNFDTLKLSKSDLMVAEIYFNLHKKFWNYFDCEDYVEEYEKSAQKILNSYDEINFTKINLNDRDEKIKSAALTKIIGKKIIN